MTIYYCDAPSGAGKTYSIQKIAMKKVRKGQNVIIVQPTTDLIKQTASTLFENGLHCRVIHSENSNGKVISEITKYLKEPYPEAHIVLITWSAFHQLPYFHRPDNWHIFVDEVPQVHVHESFNASLSHCLFTDHVLTETRGPVYSLLQVSDKSAIRKLSEEGARDEAAKAYSPIARRLLSNQWELYVNEQNYDCLLDGTKKELSVFSVMKHTVFANFASVTISGARMMETPLYKIWSDKGIQFTPHKELTSNLRYHSHSGGEKVHIYYAYENEWSKTLRDKRDKKILNLYIGAVMKEVGNEKFLWMANSDIKKSPFPENANGLQLPNVPHGLNEYQYEYDAFVSLSALNPTPEHFKFLEWYGVDAEGVRTATYRHSVYQAAFRCSIRNPENDRPIKLFVPDKSTAIWLQSIIHGSEVVSLEIDTGNLELKTRRGRKKIHGSDNERKEASRKRQSLRMQFIVDQLYNGSGTVTTNGGEPINSSIKSCDENTFTKDQQDNYLDASEKERMRFHGSIWDHDEARKPSSLKSDITHENFIKQLRLMSKTKFEDKTKNKLISPSCFIKRVGINTYRGLDNILFSNGVWLDFDKGNLTPKVFSSFFPKLRIIAFSTWSSTKEQPRWRAYIPTDCVMSIDEYQAITKEFLRKMIDSGYRHKKVDPSQPLRKAHGLDLGKMGPSCLFYLPCLSQVHEASFFLDFKKDRKTLCVQEWIAFGSIVNETEAVDDPDLQEAKANIDISPHIERWREQGTLQGCGDSEMYVLANDLHRIGIRGTRLESILVCEAALAHSPKDRLRQVKRIMKSLRSSALPNPT